MAGTMITPSTEGTETLWRSVYREILFGLADPYGGYPWIYSGVTNVNGKAKFTSSGFNVYGTPPCRMIHVDSGVYDGIHIVNSIDDDGNILTETDYISNASGLDVRCLVNYNFRVHYGYPTQTSTVDIQPYWKNDGTMIANIAPYLQPVFSYPEPVAGFDDSLYTHFRVQVIAGEDYNEWLVAVGLNPVTDVEATTGWDYDDDSDPNAPHKWYALNGSLKYSELVQGYIATDDELSEEEILVPLNHCVIFSKIVGDRVFNVQYCNGESAQSGVGFWEVATEFIVS